MPTIAVDLLVVGGNGNDRYRRARSGHAAFITKIRKETKPPASRLRAADIRDLDPDGLGRAAALHLELDRLADADPLELGRKVGEAADRSAVGVDDHVADRPGR